jgi:hypothetical protein
VKTGLPLKAQMDPASGGLTESGTGKMGRLLSGHMCANGGLTENAIVKAALQLSGRSEGVSGGLTESGTGKMALLSNMPTDVAGGG